MSKIGQKSLFLSNYKKGYQNNPSHFQEHPSHF